MPMSVMTGGVRRPIVRAKIMHLGALRTIRTIKIMHGDVLRTVANFTPPLSASASPASADGRANESGFVTVYTNTVTCSPIGGQAPFTYAWSHLSGDTFTVSNPGSSATFFYRGGLGIGGGFVGIYRCTVTDALGQTATVDVPVSVINEGPA